MKYSLDNSNFLEEISTLFILLCSSISLNWSLRKAFLSLLAILWTLHSVVYIFPSLLLFFSQLFVSPLQKTILSSCISFPLRGFWPSLLYNVTNSSSAILLQAFCLSDLISWIYLSLPLYNHKGFDLGHNGKASAYNVGDLGSIPGSERFSGEGNGNPLQYSCLENPMDGGAW